MRGGLLLFLFIRVFVIGLTRWLSGPVNQIPLVSFHGAMSKASKLPGF